MKNVMSRDFYEKVAINGTHIHACITHTYGVYYGDQTKGNVYKRIDGQRESV